ncbi:MAG: hypothetical protein AAF493_26865 [Pseudomonadota bacterium]
MNRLTSLGATLSGLLLSLSLPVSAANHALDLTASGSSRYFDYFSNSYAQIDQGWDNPIDDPDLGPSAVLDGFFLIEADPGIPGSQADDPIGGGLDVFPTETDWSGFGSLEYDDSGLDGSGNGTGAITGLTLDVLPFVMTAAITGNTYTTTVDSFSGTVEVQNGQVSSIDLTSGITLEYPASGGFPAAPYSGTFNISGADFALLVDDTVTVTPFSLRQAWDIDGTVAVVPIPAAAVLLPSALLALGVVARRRTRARKV